MPEYVINDRRGIDPPQQVCRVCGGIPAHSLDYNKPTMDCVYHLRDQMTKFNERCHLAACLWGAKAQGAAYSEVEKAAYDECAKELLALVQRY